MLKIEIQDDGNLIVSSKGNKVRILGDLTYAIIRMIDEKVFTLNDFIKAMACALDCAETLKTEKKKEEMCKCQKLN